MINASYIERRGELQTYFDRTAAEAWARLTSTAPVSRIRATVRAGRDQMRATLLSYLPQHLAGMRLLDAGCGTGAFSVAAAQRGADVLAVDIAGTLVNLAGERTPSSLNGGRIEFQVGDMSDPALGEFDHVVAMDSLIHYGVADVVRVLTGIAGRTRHSIVFTFAPRTAALTVLHTIGLWFPRKDRAPAIVPIAEAELRRQLAREPSMRHWRVGRSQRISSGFYKSHAMELVKS
jgi:magnesium-protoporphyrin O-methyltransferase